MQIKLSFLGAAQNVTGSRYLLEANEKRMLIDCGLYQERDFRDRNWDPFPIPPNSLDAILLTHAHLDHCGLIPKLVREGFNGRIYCTDATSEIANIVILDSGKIQEEDAKYKLKRHKKQKRKGRYPVVPLYTVDDARACAHLFMSVKYEEPRVIGDGLEVTFFDAGHILGSSHVQVRITQNGEERKIVFSGDVGRWDKPILCDPTPFSEADYVVVESTYGDRLHEKTRDIEDSLADVVNSTLKNRGNIVIPSFAIERSQEVLYHLNQLLAEERIPHLMVFLDSPMAIRVTEVFKDHPELFDEEMMELIRKRESPFDFTGLKTTRTVGQSKSINQIKGTAIIIAGSGMCTGGRVKHHLINNISRRGSTMLFVGYQAHGTLGRRIVDGADEVRILGKKRAVNAKIARIYGFSAHADRDELFRWLSDLQKPVRHLFVTHGETKAAHSFADFVRNKTGWQVSVPAYKDKVILE